MSISSLAKIIEVDSEKCVNCHACITACPVKYCNDGTGEFVNVNQDMCIGCGKCIRACSHEARLYLDDFQRFLTDVIAGEKIIAICAPSVAAGFPNKYLKLNTFFKEIGIAAVFDVSFGAELTVRSYLEELQNNGHETIITQPCPAIVTYIELYKPELLKYLAPVDSPMLHTIKMIKEFYPQYKDHKIAVLSPCNAKKREFEETGLGEYNIGHKSLVKFLEESKTDLDKLKDTDYDNPPAERAVLFSNPGGLLNTAERWEPGISEESRKIEGVPLIYEYLETLPEIIKKGMAPKIIDCLSCEFGCNSGPLTITEGKSQDEIEYHVNKRSKELKERYLKENNNNEEDSIHQIEEVVEKYWKKDLYSRTYVNRWKNVDLKYPNQRELNEIYETMHKFLKEDIKNCSACGYGSCEGMAVAIHNNLNRPENCHFYLAHQTIVSNEEIIRGNEKLSNILDTSIDGFVETNNDEIITRTNDAFKEILKQNDIYGRNIYEFLDEKNTEIYKEIINLRGGKDNKSFELEFMQSDKKSICCLVSSANLIVDGMQVGSFSMISDISKLKKAEIDLRKINETLEEKVKERTNDLSEALEEVSQRSEEILQQQEEIMAQRDSLSVSEEKVKYILASMPDATFVIDKYSKVTHWNHAMTELTGVDSIDMIGKDNYEYSIPFYGERKPILIDYAIMEKNDPDEKYKKIKRVNGVLEAEFQVESPETGIKGYFVGRAVAIYDNEGQISGAIEIIHDITQKETFLEKIGKQKKKITDSIHYASYIQDALLPPEDQMSEYLKDSFVLYQPRDIVSGDFYWFEKFLDKTIIVVADCTGHGVPGAFMSMLGISFLNEVVIKNQVIKPNKILDELRESVIKALRQTDENNIAKDGMDMSIIVIDENSNTLEYAGANRPLIRIKNNEVIEYKSDNRPIGIHPKGMDPFKSHVIELEKDDVFYMFSDGYSDQLDEIKNKKFMKKRFKDLLLKIHKKPMTEQHDILKKEFYDWKGNFDQIDDVLVFGFKF